MMFIPALIPAQTKRDIFNPDVPLVFLGADFSKIMFTKAAEFNNKDQILRFFVDCNYFMDTEAAQRTISKRLNRADMKRDISYVNKTNASVDWQHVYSDDTEYGLSDEAIENMIKQLNIDQQLYKDHLGFVLCEENYSKTKERGMLAVVFFNVNELKPVFIKHYSFKPSGFGFMYYWLSVNTQTIASLKKLKKEVNE
jgi:hypothetical protein